MGPVTSGSVSSASSLALLVVAVAGEVEEGLLIVGLDQVAIMDLQGEIIDCTLIKAP